MMTDVRPSEETPNPEDSLEHELLENANRPTRPSFEWLNTPFVLWMLTTLAAGFVGFTYTNYATCRSAQISDDLKVYGARAELEERARAILGILNHNKLDGPEVIARLTKYFDPTVGFVLSDFKGKTVREIYIDTRATIQKYGLWREAHSIRPGCLEGDRTNCEASDVSDTDRFIQMFAIAIGTVEYEINDPWRQGKADPKVLEKAEALLDFLMMSDTDNTGDYERPYNNIRPSVCLSRTFWPFGG